MERKVPILARRKLFSTTSAQEVGKVRAALTQLDIPFHIGQTDITAPIGAHGVLGLHPDAPLPAYEYTIYVHRDDLELAQSALAGIVEE